METSVLYTIKTMLDVVPSNCDFDTFILVAINSAISVLVQLGVVTGKTRSVIGIEETWSDLLGDDEFFEAAKMFVYIKTRLIFDPPANSFVVNAFNDQLKEYEWRLAVLSDERRLANESANTCNCSPRNQGNEVGCKKNAGAIRA